MLREAATVAQARRWIADAGYRAMDVDVAGAIAGTVPTASQVTTGPATPTSLPSQKAAQPAVEQAL